MELNPHKKEVLWSIGWFFGFILAYLLFFPLTMGGDFFGTYISVYFYFVASLLFVWTTYLISKPLSASFPIRITKLVLILAIFFPISGYYYNGRMRYIRNAAEHNYPRVLNLFLDTSNQEELDFALDCAGFGKNAEIIEDLKAKGAK